VLAARDCQYVEERHNAPLISGLNGGKLTAARRVNPPWPEAPVNCVPSWGWPRFRLTRAEILNRNSLFLKDLDLKSGKKI
jgi:hypothetical protein